MYAVKEASKGKGKKRQLSDMSDDESVQAKNPCMENFFHINDRLDSIDVKLSKILAANGRISLPIGLASCLLETFKCSICHDPINPPAIFGRCCKKIVGCQRCVDTWYHGEQGLSRTCPLCRGDRGYADTCIMNGLDTFFNNICGMLSTKPAGVPVPPDNIDDIDDI